MARESEIFGRLRRKMDALYGLLQDLNGPDKGQQRHVISRIAVEGRAITNILQNLRSAVGRDEFNEWYKPFLEEMKTDPLMRFFYDLRSRTLKKGDDGVEGTRVSARGGFRLTPQGIDQFLRNPDGSTTVISNPAPKNAIAAFVADDTGGAGWEVKQSDGSIMKVYAPLLPAAAEVMAILKDPPQRHLGADLPDTKPTTLCMVYVDYLRKLIEKARHSFLGKDAETGPGLEHAGDNDRVVFRTGWPRVGNRPRPPGLRYVELGKGGSM